MIKNLKMRGCRYFEDLSPKELIMGAGISLFFAFFFYRSIWAIPFMLPIGTLFVGWTHQKKLQKRDAYFLEQFKECILSVSANLKAGYAVENAFLESMSDMQMMFGENSMIVDELYRIQKGLRNNETLENLLFAMAWRSGAEDVLEFAEVFAIAKRNSGNIPETINVYSKSIEQKLAVVDEIQTLLAAKQLEQKIMNVMPFVIILYLEYSSPGYFDMMFHNFSGVVIMTGCLACYVCAYWMSVKIFRGTFG